MNHLHNGLRHGCNGRSADRDGDNAYGRNSDCGGNRGKSRRANRDGGKRWWGNGYRHGGAGTD